MSEDTRPLSELVAQGWEIAGFSSVHNGVGFSHTVLLRRQRQHKVITLSKRAVLGGISLAELDV